MTGTRDPSNQIETDLSVWMEHSSHDQDSLRALIGFLAAAAVMAGGMTVATAQPVGPDYVATGVTGSPAADGVVIAMLLAFAFGWVAVELRRSSH